jgi:succinate dehydrogenase / fumarate reductase membrane anchor subunit
MRESKLWFLHIVTAIIVLVLLSSHMGIMHLGYILDFFGFENAVGPTSAENVFARSEQVLFMVLYIVLLGAALFHGLYGLRSIICELSLPGWLEKTVGRLFCVVGVLLFVYGSYVAVYLVQNKGEM